MSNFDLKKFAEDLLDAKILVTLLATLGIMIPGFLAMFYFYPHSFYQLDFLKLTVMSSAFTIPLVGAMILPKIIFAILTYSKLLNDQVELLKRTKTLGEKFQTIEKDIEETEPKIKAEYLKQFKEYLSVQSELQDKLSNEKQRIKSDLVTDGYVEIAGSLLFIVFFSSVAILEQYFRGVHNPRLFFAQLAVYVVFYYLLTIKDIIKTRWLKNLVFAVSFIWVLLSNVSIGLRFWPMTGV